MVQNKTFSAKALQTFVAVMFAVITYFGFMTTPTAEAASGFYVSGTSIYDASGNKFVMRGVNIAHAWYTEKTETSIKGAANNGANTVRVVLANGSKYTKTSAQEVKNIISWCKSNKLICILEVHDATGSDSTYDLNKCVDYWKEMKSVLSGTEKYVIVNIANEWRGTWNGSAWADGYKSAIQSVRNAGITNMLMVDCAGWGQYPDSIKDYGKSVFNADSQKNTVFSIHMYEYAGGNASTVRNNIDNALNIGVPVVIGEFGGQHTNGDVDEATIMSYCTSKGVGYLGWSWKGNNSDMSYLDIAHSWDGSSLSSWGNTLINGSNGIKATSKTCSVYSGSGSSSGGSSSGTSTDSNGGVLGLDGTYYIKSALSGKYLDVYKAKADNGTNVQQYRGTGGNNQKFQLVKIGDAYAIKTKISDCYSCLDVYEQSTADGANINQWSYWGGKLDQIHAGAANGTVTIYSVCYCW